MTVGLLLIALGVFGLALMVGRWWAGEGAAGRARARRRLDRLTRDEAARALTPGSADGVPAGGLSAHSGAVTGVLSFFLPSSRKERARLQRQLFKAGFARPDAVALLGLVQWVVPAVLSLLALAALGIPDGIGLAMFGGLVGYFLPGLVLGHLAEGYQKEIERGLPDALDMLVVCIEAGVGLDQALKRTGTELAVAHPRLAHELTTVNTEILAGKPRSEAFRNFASRTQVEDVRSLAGMLIQTDRFGTSVSQALRTQAETARTKRRQRAEEQAAKLGVKMVFPLVLFLFPAMYVVTLGPAVIQFVRVFMQQVAAGR